MASEQERIRLYSELPDRIAYLFQDDAEVVYAEKAEKNAKKHADRVAILTDFLAWLEAPHELFEESELEYQAEEEAKREFLHVEQEAKREALRSLKVTKRRRKTALKEEEDSDDDANETGDMVETGVL